jgi:hypothetical protein
MKSKKRLNFDNSKALSITQDDFLFLFGEMKRISSKRATLINSLSVLRIHFGKIIIFNF